VSEQWDGSTPLEITGTASDALDSLAWQVATLTAQLTAATERADLLEHQRCDLESALHSSERHVAHFRERAETAERIAATEKAEYAACEEEFIRAEVRVDEAEHKRSELAETYRRDSAAWHELQDTLVRQRDAAVAARDEAEAGAAAARSAIHEIMWPGCNAGVADQLVCGGCGQSRTCPAYPVLSGTAGAAMLARLKRLEAVADAAQYHAAVCREPGYDMADAEETLKALEAALDGKEAK
jgi:hypothetical protein